MEQMFFSRKVSLGWVICLVIASVLTTVLYLGNWSVRHNDWATWIVRPVEELATQSHGPECVHMPGADEVLVTLRTGATEAYEKLPIHLMTTVKCIPNHIVLSDLESKIGETPVQDIVASIPAHIRDQYQDFELYNDIQRWSGEGQDVRDLPSDAAWNLDKWKFMPMLHHAFENAPNTTKWFVFIEADTSLSWLNMLHWLGAQDPREALYFGAPAPYLPVDDFFFAHGGSGIVVSRPALEQLEHARAREQGGPQAYDRRWEKAVNETCCGDVIIGQALEEVGVKITNVRPMLHGESPRTMVWDSENWCAPAITWHHVNAQEVDRLWQFEQEWIERNGLAQPYFFSDIFEEMIDVYVSANQSFWNNMSKKSRGEAYDASSERFGELEPYEQDAAHFMEACAAVCRQKSKKECVQWKWTAGKCQLARNFVFGVTDEQEDEHWISGWLLDRFKASVSTCR